MKIEVHLLQNFAPSCLNRDDTNTPKTCDFGGITRARISSQCFKRAVRQQFEELGIEKGTRSKRIKEAIAQTLAAENTVAQELFAALSTNKEPQSEPAQHLSTALTLFVEAYYSPMDKKRPHETEVLLYWSGPEVREAADCFREEQSKLEAIVPAYLQARAETKVNKGKKGNTDKTEDEDGKKPAYTPDNKTKKRLQQASLSPDIALFGRMLASNPDSNIDAACQVAHALSTHATNLEMDFFTAVDDRNPEGTTGAGMLGVTGYDSACFYRYALLDMAQLQKNLGNSRTRAEEAAQGFLTGFVQAIPTGKQNSMAAQSPPSLVLFAVRDKGVPCSLVNAFARPIKPIYYQDDLVGGSITELAAYWQRLNKMYSLEKGATLALTHDRDAEAKDSLGILAAYDKGSLDDAIAATMEAVRGAKTEAAS